MQPAAEQQQQDALWSSTGLASDGPLDRTGIRWVAGSVLPAPAHDEPQPARPFDFPLAKRRVIEPAVWRQTEPTRDKFVPLQRWEGVVLEVEGEHFSARLTNLTADGPLEEAQLQLIDVADEDLDLVQRGAVFYWSIGYMNSSSGQRSRVSTLRFRRLPVWSREEIEAGKLRAATIAEILAH